MNTKPKKCAGPDCNKDAVQKSPFCGESCQKAVEKEVEDAPYGDQFLFPTLTET